MYKEKYEENRQKLYNVLSAAEYGTSYSYNALSEIMGLDSEKFRYVIFQVQKKLEKEANRTLRNDFGVGYSVARPEEHIGLAGKRHKRAKRQLKKARSIIHSTNKKALSIQDRSRVDAIEQNLKAQADAIRHLERGQKFLEETQVKQIKVSQSLELQLAEAMNRIAALESRKSEESWRRPVRPSTRTHGQEWSGTV